MIVTVFFNREMQVVRRVPGVRRQRPRRQVRVDAPAERVAVRAVRLAQELPVVLLGVQRGRADHPVPAVLALAPRGVRSHPERAGGRVLRRRRLHLPPLSTGRRPAAPPPPGQRSSGRRCHEPGLVRPPADEYQGPAGFTEPPAHH